VASFPGSYTDSPFAIAHELPVPLAVAIGLLVGGIMSFPNGFIVAKSRIEPFIVTLATMVFVRGVTFSQEVFPFF
jgi:ribose transport system permease protein